MPVDHLILITIHLNGHTWLVHAQSLELERNYKDPSNQENW